MIMKITLGLLNNPIEVGRLENYLRDIYRRIPIVTQGTAAPTITPGNIGDYFIDTNNKKLYVAMATTNSGSWTVLN